MRGVKSKPALGGQFYTVGDTMHDISLRRAGGANISGGGEGRLLLEGTVKTYRYIDANEAAELASE